MCVPQFQLCFDGQNETSEKRNQGERGEVTSDKECKICAGSKCEQTSGIPFSADTRRSDAARLYQNKPGTHITASVTCEFNRELITRLPHFADKVTLLHFKISNTYASVHSHFS